MSKQAVAELFESLAKIPTVTVEGSLEHWRATDIDIFVGDFFELTADVLGKIDAIFDRAALVALPLTMRIRYAANLGAITNFAPQLVITYTYDQEAMGGPPFSITKQEIIKHYQSNYTISKLASLEVEGG
ncbi:MAG: thiopurine S-methyltransferase, partial [Chloroflexota bacterium]